MQISNSANIFVFTCKKYVEVFTLRHLLRFEIRAHEICEKFVYKHAQKQWLNLKIKISLLSEKFTKFMGK